MKLKSTFANRTDKPKAIAARYKGMTYPFRGGCLFAFVRFPVDLGSKRMIKESWEIYKKRRLLNLSYIQPDLSLYKIFS
ncbi:MAG: hypothetical protein V4687_16185 [Bacteroidota bacterium]